MKTISLWQPWASAIPAGLKRIETRGWATSYRGPLAIHAAQRDTRYLRSWWETRVPAHLDPALDSMPGAAAAFAALGIHGYDDLPRGAVIATCVLQDCWPTARLTGPQCSDLPHVDRGGQEWKWGDFRNTNDRPEENGKPRWGWLLSDVVPLSRPVSVTGRQGFFDVPEELLRSAA